MFCRKCGAKLHEQDLFCSACGARVEKIEGKEEIEEQLLDREANEDKFALLKEKFSGFDFDQIWKKGVASGKLPVLLGALVVVLLLFLGILVGGSLKKDEKVLQENTGVQTEVSDSIKEKMDGLLEEGAKLLKEGNFEGALAKYEEAKATTANYEELYLFGADIYLKQNNYNMALQLLKEGYEVTASNRLTLRRDYIKSNIVLVGVKSQDGEVNFYRQYDEAGNLFREHKYDGEYRLTGWEESQYDEQGRKIRSVLYNAQGVQEADYSYEYDERGNLLYRTDYDAGKAVIATHQYVYDGAGRQISCDDFDQAGTAVWSTQTEYDDQGRKIKDLGYDESGNLKSWVETIYNEDGTVAKMTRYDENNAVIEWNESQYNAEGNEIGFTTYDGNNTVIYRTETEYDASGQKTARTRYNSDGTVYSRCEFDQAGNIVKETLEGQQMTYQHAYFYFGDLLCENDIQPVFGVIKIMKPISYRNIPNKASSYAGTLYTDKTYEIIGRTEEFYQLAQGGYLEKEFAGTAYATVEQ